ncbi:ABC transporter permease [Streptomyces albidoflavus]
MAAVTRLARDATLIAWRNLLNLRRTPGSVVAALIQPVMFVLLLSYVFGGSLGGDAYRTYLMGGIFAQAVTFNAAFTALGLANDLDRGIVDRFRSLPMPPMAVILGRALSDLTMSALTVAVTSLCGLFIGWRIAGTLPEAVLAYLLILLFAFAMSWVGATIGLTARSVEVAQSAGLIWLFPVTFLSSAFVPTATLPTALQPVADWNPVSATATALRTLFANPAPPTAPLRDTWPVTHALPYALLSTLAITAVFMGVAVRRFRAMGRG